MFSAYLISVGGDMEYRKYIDFIDNLKIGYEIKIFIKIYRNDLYIFILKTKIYVLHKLLKKEGSNYLNHPKILNKYYLHKLTC